MSQVVFATNRSVPSRSKWYLRRAWYDLLQEQEWEEDRLTRAILDGNELGILFREPRKRDRWGEQSRDLVYGLWNEEDLRLKLAGQLGGLDYCQVHGQVHFRSRRGQNRRKASPRTKKARYPDIICLSLKRKERMGKSGEPNIEVAALELKQFALGCSRQTVESAVKTDLSKLAGYCIRKFRPQADCGFFFCLDETGFAEEILQKLLASRQYRKRPLGFGILVPGYTRTGITYTGMLDDLPVPARQATYLMNLVAAKLARAGLSDKAASPYSWNDGFFRIELRLQKSAKGWLFAFSPGAVKGLGREWLPIMLYLRGTHEVVGACLRRYKPLYAWQKKTQRFEPTMRGKSRVLLLKIPKKRLAQPEQAEKFAKILVRAMKRICAMYERRSD
jgi:hypothetical protein